MRDYLEAISASLERTGDYRVLRRLAPRSRFAPPSEAPLLHAIILDVETTGLSHKEDEIIELGMLKFSYSENGQIHEVVDTFSALREPAIPLPEAITGLTGITNNMVAGKVIDISRVETFIGDAAIVIAHNANFDRPFCEAAWPVFQKKPWACSSVGINWRMRGHTGNKLGYLLYDDGLFHNSHRALDDCRAVVEILSRPKDSATGTPLAELLARARKSTVRLRAESVPLHRSDFLKRRGYRWSNGNGGQPKAWWKDVLEDETDAELSFLAVHIYEGNKSSIRISSKTAFERFSKRDH